MDKQTYCLIRTCLMDAFLVPVSLKQTLAKVSVQIIYLGDAGNTDRGVKKRDREGKQPIRVAP